MISASTAHALQRQFLAASNDFGVAKVNYIMGNASTTGKGDVKTNTLGIRVPIDKVTLALSIGAGNYTNAAANNGTPTIASKLEDTTIGAFYYFDKDTSAYFFTSRAKNSVSHSSGDTDHTQGTMGRSNTSALGLRYYY